MSDVITLDLDRNAVAPPTPLARRSSMWHDLVTVARRAIRGVFREPEFIIPALVVPVFFYIVNVGSLQDFAATVGRGRRLQGVPAPGGDHLRRHRHLPRQCARDRHPERLLRPVAADADPTRRAAARSDGRRRRVDHHAHHPGADPRSRHRRALRDRCARHVGVHPLRRLLGPGLRRVPVRDRLEDR